MPNVSTDRSAEPTRTAVVPASRSTSILVNGYFPRRRGLVILFGFLGGFLLTVIWSAEFVDSVIGDNVANHLLGTDAKEAPLAGLAAGIGFAFVTGLAGTFTACNIAAFATLAPMLGSAGGRRHRLAQASKPLFWLSVGMVAVSATYGAVVGLVGPRMPQFSTAANEPGALSPRSIQSMVVFGIVGLAMVYLGLSAVGVVRDPFARLSRRLPNAPLVVLGALIGAFLIGRPFGLFRQMFRDAAESGNPLYGAAAFTLQSFGNIVVLVVLFFGMLLVGGRVHRWFAADPRRLTVMVAVSLIIAGVFTFLYWDVRLLARREIIPWYPMAPWT